MDGIGHVSGGIGLVVIAGSVPPSLGAQQNGALYAFVLIAAVIAQFGIQTRGKRLRHVSP